MKHNEAGNLYKPEVQRKLMWKIYDPENKKCNFRAFLEHVFKHKDSSQILVVQNILGKIILVDGNNRTNAFLTFAYIPYKIFPDFFIDFNNKLKNEVNDNELYKDIVKIYITTNL